MSIRKKKEGVIMKIDFEKAYDHMDDALVKKGFKNRWRNWNRGCLVSVNFSVLANGRPICKFGAFRGLRQVDPLITFSHLL